MKGKKAALNQEQTKTELPAYETKLSLPAARPFGKVIPIPPNPTQSLAAVVATISMFGIAVSNPVINWICFFVLLSMVINKKRERSRVSQSLIALISCIFGLAFLYNRFLYGIVSRKSLLEIFNRE